MTGDPPEAGDHPDTKPVFDLEVLGLLEAVAALQAGQDLGGHPLTGTPTFCVGAVVNPGAPDRQKELRRLEDKMARGAQFFQTQAVYDPAAFAQFMDNVRHHDVTILASIIVLRSGNMARRLHQSFPGLSIPDHVIAELDGRRTRCRRGLPLLAGLSGSSKICVRGYTLSLLAMSVIFRRSCNRQDWRRGNEQGAIDLFCGPIHPMRPHRIGWWPGVAALLPLCGRGHPLLFFVVLFFFWGVRSVFLDASSS